MKFEKIIVGIDRQSKISHELKCYNGEIIVNTAPYQLIRQILGWSQ